MTPLQLARIEILRMLALTEAKRDTLINTLAHIDRELSDTFGAVVNTGAKSFSELVGADALQKHR